MILRSVMKHVRDQNWFAVGVDLLIVVVGVFIGIQVSNWNQSRVDSNTESTYLELLQRDLRTTIEDAEKQIAFEQYQVRLANAALPLIEQQPSELRRRKLGMILTQLGARRTLKIDSPTFLDLRSSGRLGLIADPELRSFIVSYFFGIQRWEAIIDKNNEHFVDSTFNAFTDDISVGYWLWDEEVMELSPPLFLSMVLAQRRESVDPRLLEAGGAALMASPDAVFWEEVKTRLGKRASIASANESVAASLRDATLEVEEKIAAYLDMRK